MINADSGLTALLLIMNAEILKSFLEESESCLPTMRAGIIAYERDSGRLAELQASRRLAHTIKDSALTLKQAEIVEIAEEIESHLKTLIRTRSILTEDQASDLLSKILILEFLLKDLNDKALADSGAANSNISRKTSDSSGAEEFEIDPEMLDVFAQEAEDLLRNICVNLAILEKTPDNYEALLEIRRSAHTLKGSAGIIGLKKLSGLAHRVEDLLDFLAENAVSGSRRIFILLQTSFDYLSALANNEETPQLNQNIEIIYRDFEEILAQIKNEKDASIIDLQKLQTGITDEMVRENPVVITEKPDTGITENAAANPANANRSVVRVSLGRLNDLFNLIGEMVITRSVFEQRINDFEQQISELRQTTRRLRASTDKLEIDLESGSGALSSQTSNSNFLFNTSSPGFDDLEFDRYTDLHQTTHELVEAASDTSAINSGLNNLSENFKLLFDNQRRLIEEMQENLLRLRMVSLNSLMPRLQRTIRVTAREEEKLAELIIENETLEIDAEILDVVVEPLLHLLRNAVAHGIETPDERRAAGKPEKGKITLRAFIEGTHVVFIVSDDGRGISASGLKEKAVRSGFISKSKADTLSDEESYSLVFLPGLSTARQINQVSGRGVGMNIVKTCVTRRHGTITIKSEAGVHTSFTIRLPVSLAVTRALLAEAADRTYALPLDLVKQVIEISPQEFAQARQKKVFQTGETLYSFCHFNQLLGLPASSSAAETSSAVLVLLLKAPEKSWALAVDRIIKTDEIIIKPLDALFKHINEFTGATILGDGSVVPVLDLVNLLEKRDQNKSEIRQTIGSDDDARNSPPKTLSILIVDDSPSVRMVNAGLIKKAGWQPLIAKDGIEALEILQESKRNLPDVILTDVEMPRMDGYDFLATLKKQPVLRHIPVIMITSRAGEKHRAKAFDLGADEYISKPYEDAELLDKIKTLTKFK